MGFWDFRLVERGGHRGAFGSLRRLYMSTHEARAGAELIILQGDHMIKPEILLFVSSLVSLGQSIVEKCRF